MVHLKIILAGPAGFRPAGTPALPGVRPSACIRAILAVYNLSLQQGERFVNASNIILLLFVLPAAAAAADECFC